MKHTIIILTVILNLIGNIKLQGQTSNVDMDTVDLKFSSLKLTEMTLLKAVKVDSDYFLIRKEISKNHKEYEYYVEHYNNELKLVKSSIISKTIKGKNIKLESIETIKNSFVIITSVKNKKEKNYIVYAQKILLPDLEILEKVVVHEYSYRGFYIPKFLIQKSVNEDYLLFASLSFGDKTTVSYEVYSSELKLLFFDKGKVLEDDSHLFILQTFITKNKEVLLVSGSPYKFQGKRAYKIYNLTKGNEGSYEFKGDYLFENRFLQLFFREDIDGNLIGGGFYSNKGNSDYVYVKGVLSFHFDVTDMAISDFSSSDFSLDLIKKGVSEKQLVKFNERIENNRPIGMNRLSLSDVQIFHNGSYCVIGYERSKLLRSDQPALLSEGSMVVSMFSMHGEVLWTKKLARPFKFVSNFTDKPKYFKNENDLYILFLERKEIVSFDINDGYLEDYEIEYNLDEDPNLFYYFKSEERFYLNKEVILLVGVYNLSKKGRRIKDIIRYQLTRFSIRE